jgi:hypothetical protein
MTVQLVIYSKATGRVRRTWDPNVAVPNVLLLIAQCGAQPGEGVVVYNKAGGGQDTLLTWQAAVNAVTGKSVVVGVDAGDTYAIVDSNNNIVNVVAADPACGDVVPAGLQLVLAPAGCSTNWTYDGTTFTAPSFPTVPH